MIGCQSLSRHFFEAGAISFLYACSRPGSAENSVKTAGKIGKPAFVKRKHFFLVQQRNKPEELGPHTHAAIKSAGRVRYQKLDVFFVQYFAIPVSRSLLVASRLFRLSAAAVLAGTKQILSLPIKDGEESLKATSQPGLWLAETTGQQDCRGAVLITIPAECCCRIYSPVRAMTRTVSLSIFLRVSSKTNVHVSATPPTRSRKR